ncbi:hypothetical protein M0R45_018477 [Rubus argutus]|uniref:Uncharacterized protein n=1 Tax=Rubus argutus TaxID=59490 RepID=A0AAW1X3Z9_RUBAR
MLQPIPSILPSPMSIHTGLVAPSRPWGADVNPTRRTSSDTAPLVLLVKDLNLALSPLHPLVVPAIPSQTGARVGRLTAGRGSIPTPHISSS